MEDLLTNAFNTGDIKIVIAALVVYAIVYLQRRDTKSKRDEANENLDKRVSLLEQKAQQIDELDLATKLAQIQTDLQWIKSRLMEGKQK
jgi:archaellum component FlaF (FlaF/FlaG flagellin family)